MAKRYFVTPLPHLEGTVVMYDTDNAQYYEYHSGVGFIQDFNPIPVAEMLDKKEKGFYDEADYAEQPAEIIRAFRKGFFRQISEETAEILCHVCDVGFDTTISDLLLLLPKTDAAILDMDRVMPLCKSGLFRTVLLYRRLLRLHNIPEKVCNQLLSLHIKAMVSCTSDELDANAHLSMDEQIVELGNSTAVVYCELRASWTALMEQEEYSSLSKFTKRRLDDLKEKLSCIEANFEDYDKYIAVSRLFTT